MKSAKLAASSFEAAPISVAGRGAEPIKVLHVAETLIGGPASYINAVLTDQIGHFGREGVRVIGPSDHLRYIADPSVCVGFERSGRDFVSARRLKRCIEDVLAAFDPEIVHLHSFFAGFVTRTMVDRKSLAGRSVIYCPHGWAFSRRVSLASRWMSRGVEWALQGRADAIHCISQHEYLCGARAGISGDRMFCLPNRIPDAPVEPFRAPPSTFSPAASLRVAFVGRLDQQKGFDVLVQAARIARAGVEFAVAGAPAVDGFGKGEPIPANMLLLGWLSPAETQALVREADVVVVPSRWEGFSLAALEAMRAGKALVASRVDALPELVDHRITGLLTPPCDARALADALGSLSRERAREMGRAARRKFELFFSFEMYANALRWRYGALCSARAGQEQQKRVRRAG